MMLRIAPRAGRRKDLDRMLENLRESSVDAKVIKGSGGSKNSPWATKNVLMISYYFPPILDVGSLRSQAFSKHLPAYGWQPTVLTVSNPYRNYCRIGDNQPSQGLRIFRAPSLFNPMAVVHLANGVYARLRRALRRPASYGLYAWLTNAWLPDLFAPWIPGALITGLRARTTNFHGLYASCSPFSAAIVGAILKKRFKVPLVLDFRDPMTSRIHRKPEGLSDLARHRLERWVLGACDHLIVTSEETRDRYLETYPLLEGKISVIHNGFHDLFLTLNKRRLRMNSRFTVLYSGNFYYDLIPPRQFFSALRNLLESRSIPESRIVLRYVGERDYWITELIRESNLQNIFETTGHVPRQRLIEYLRGADVVFLRNYKPCITTKLYEGLALGKVFLATIEPGEVEAMIKRYSPQSVIASPADQEGIARAILELYGRWESANITDQVSEEYLATHNWHTLTGKLATILDQTQQPLLTSARLAQ
jgi:glycosyltransferase involved in cell wall biosynthesis